MHVLAIIFLVVWFSFALLIGGVLFVAALLGALEGESRQVLVAAPFLIVSAIAIVAFGRFLGRKEERYLLDFVRYMLDAR